MGHSVAISPDTCDGEVVVVVKVDGWDVRVLINIQVNEFIGLIRDVVLLERAVHVQRPAEALPGVAGSMLVQVDVAVEDLIEGLLAADVDHVVVLRVKIDDSQFSCLLSQGADSQRFVLPPGQSETVGVPLRVGHNRGNMEVAAQGTVPPVQVRLGVDGALRLLSDLIEPVSDISASNFGDRCTQFALSRVVVSQKFGQVIDTVEEADPAVVSRLVLGDLLRRVVPAQLVGLGQMCGILLA